MLLNDEAKYFKTVTITSINSVFLLPNYVGSTRQKCRLMKIGKVW